MPKWMVFGKPLDPTKQPVVTNEEVFALLEYAAHTGQAKEKVAALSLAIHKPDPDPTNVAALYADLVADTKPVTGRTVLDSRDRGLLTRLFGVSVVTAIFFLLAFGNMIADNWIADLVVPEEEPFFLKLKRYAWDYLSPFFWGGLGACVFLLKRVQDEAREFRYERHKMRGWGTRVLIGGVMAAIVLVLFDPSTLSPGPLPLRPAAIAFLVGLGVKAVYGGLEKIVDELAKRIAGETVNE